MWLQAELVELGKHQQLGTVRRKLRLDQVPEGYKPAPSTWSYRAKVKANGDKECKARWNVSDIKGVFRFQGKDFDTQYSSSLRLTACRVLCAI